MNIPVDLMEALRQHPGRFLGFKSLTALFHFISGARRVYHDGMPGDPAWLTIPSDFVEWVDYRTHHSDPCREWLKPILATTPSEEKAFDRFFELLDEYHARVPTIIAEVTGIPAPEREPWEEEVEAPPPHTVFIVKFTDDPGFFIQHEKPHVLLRGYWFCKHLIYTGSSLKGEWHIRDEAAYRKIIREDIAQSDWTQHRDAALAKRARMSSTPSWWTGTSPELHPASAFRQKPQPHSSPLPTPEELKASSKIDPRSYLHGIRRVPRHTLESKSLTALHHFIQGYYYALDSRPGRPDHHRLNLPEDFTHWVAHRTRFPDPSIGWCAMILRTSPNEAAAFDRFFDLLEDYYTHHPAS